jgi:hypothetical protein
LIGYDDFAQFLELDLLTCEQTNVREWTLANILDQILRLDFSN